MALKAINSFNAGELSPKLAHRVDLEKYHSGCRQLQNCLVLPYGGAMRRAGTDYIGSSKDHTRKSRTIGFNFSTTTNFILEFGHLYIRFWSNGVQVTSAGSPVEVVSPWDESHLFELQYVQINDVMYITHSAYPTRKLSRISDTSWTLEEVAWAWPAFRDENITTATISASATTGTGITLTASASTFTSGNVGGYYRIGHRRSDTTISVALTGNGTSAATVRVLGDWEFNTKGAWNANVLIQRSYDDGSTWETIRAWEGNSDRNIATTGTEFIECLLRIKVENYSAHSGTPNPRAYLEVIESVIYGIVKITAFTSGTIVTGTVVKALHSTTATKIWAEGSWSTRRGFPRTVTLYEQRLIFGGCTSQPQTTWASELGNFENFRYDTRDDSAFTFTLMSTEQNAITWMLAQQVLCIGTTGDEYTVSSSDNAGGITPTNIKTRRQSRYGGKYLSPVTVSEVILFVQRQGLKIREFVYNYEKDGYVAPDLTLLAEHITSGGIVQMAFQAQPDAVLWCVTGDGALIGMTYERDQNVVGWHRHITDGKFESVATIYGSAGDETWVVVNRTINGATKRYIERFDVDFRATLEAEDKDDWHYVDCGKEVINDPASATITGLSHLEGKTVQVLADGAEHANRTVSGGSITLAAPATKVQVGLGYTSLLQPMSFEIPLRDGASLGRRFRVTEVSLKVYKTFGGEFETEPGVYDPIYKNDIATPFVSADTPTTGQLNLTVGGAYSETGDITVRQTKPFPLVVLAMIPRFEVYGE